MSFNLGAVILLLLYRAIFLKMKVEPLATCIKQLIEGLDKFGPVKQIREDPIAFRLVFYHSNWYGPTISLYIPWMLWNLIGLVKTRTKRY